MAINANTLVVDGQRFSVPNNNAYNPVGYGQLVQMQPVRQLNQPPMVGVGGGSAGQGVMGTDVVGGYGTAGNNAAATIKANLNPWSIKDSPVIWAIFGLIISVIGLSAIHWRKTALAGASENLHVGEAKESANAEV